jgi:O-antigen/teichoic acid export membrane protein
MRLRLQNLMNEVIHYGMGAAVNRSLGLLVAFIYPILLNRDEYGRMDVIFSAPALLTVLFLIGLDSALARFFYESDDATRQRRLVSTVFYFVTGISLVLVGALLIASRPLALSLYGDSRYVAYFRLVLIAMPFLIASSIQMTVLRLERRVHVYNRIITASLISNALAGIACILIFNIGVTGIMIGFLTGHIVSGILTLRINKQYLSARPDIRRIPELLQFSLPLMLSGIALWIIGNVNRPILAHQVSADSLGFFAIASGGVNVMAMLIGAFQRAWQPFAFSIMEQEESNRVYGRTLTLFTFIGMTIALCGTLFAPQALLFINAYTRKDWSGAADLVGPLALGTLFDAMFFLVQTGVYIARRTSAIAWTVGAAAVASIAFNILLIPAFGIVGAAFASALGHLTALVLLYLIAQRIAPIPYQPGRLIATILVAIFVALLDFHFRPSPVMAAVAVKISLLIIYWAVLIACRVIAIKDLKMIASGMRIAVSSIRNHISRNRQGKACE